MHTGGSDGSEEPEKDGGKQEVDKFVIANSQHKLLMNEQLESFAQKVLMVLLAEAVSNTIYQVLTNGIYGASKLTSEQALISRSVYAGFITLYVPVASWLSAKSARAQKSDFVGLTLQLQAKACPVLLAWGWKDWAAQLDTWAGPAIWDELIVAVTLTSLVACAQGLPCFAKFRAGLAAGGESDTILARFVLWPNNLTLALGYVWNMVASFFVNKLQDLRPSYHYRFGVQLAYALVACFLVTLVTHLFQKTLERKVDSSVAKSQSDFQEWSDVVKSTWANLFVSALSFVYGWAILDTMDDWAFGVMYGCGGPSTCSYQQNFSYALCITVFFSVGALVLRTWISFEEGGGLLKKAIMLQINAMVLTTGWAWMNFYTAWTAEATSGIKEGETIIVYIIVLVFLQVVVSIANFVFQRTKLGLKRQRAKFISE